MKQLPSRAVLLMLLAAPGAHAQVDRTRSIKTPASPDAGVQTVSCVVQLDVDSNRSSRTFDVQTLNALLTSTALLDPAAKKALDLSPAEWPKVAQVELLPAGQFAVRVGVTVTTNPKLSPTAAQDFLTSLTTSAKAAVELAGSRSEKTSAERIATLEKDLAAAQAKYDVASATMAATPRATNSGFESSTMLRNSQGERTALAIQLAGQKARLSVLEEELSKMRPTTQSAQAIEPVPPGVPINGFGAGSVYDRFNSERITLRATIAESEAKLTEMTARATPPTTGPAYVDFDRAQMDLSNARQAVQTAQSALDSARRDTRNQGGVRLLILDGRTNLE